MEQPMARTQEETWALFCHLSAFAGLIGVGFGHLVGPLVVWLIGRDVSPFVDDQGKESVNFQLSMSLYVVLSIISVIGLILVPVLIVADIVLVIVAASRASNGELYRYPWTIRFVK